jgi:hypothetical protein
VDKGFVLDTESQFGLVVLTDGNLLHSERALAKFIVGCVKARNMHALSNVLITLHKEDLNKVCPLDVTDACIQMGWLHAVHDILDHLEGYMLGLVVTFIF